MFFIFFHQCSFFGNNKKSCPISKTINIKLDVPSFLKIIKKNDARTLVQNTFSKRGTPVLQAQLDLFCNVAVAQRKARIDPGNKVIIFNITPLAYNAPEPY